MTLRPVGAAAALALGLAISAVLGAAPAVALTSPGLPTEVAIVVPVTVAPSTAGLLNAEDLAEHTSLTGTLTKALDQLSGRPVTLAIDPMIIASIRLLGDEAPETAVAWLDRLAQVPNETFALSWADSNLTRALDAGSTAILEPRELDFAIDASRFSVVDPDPTAEPSPSSTAAPVDDSSPPPLPTTESLFEWDYTLPSVGWPAADSVSSATLPVLIDSFDHTLLSSINVGGLAPLSSTAVVGDSRVLVADSELSRLMSTTVTALSGSDWNTAIESLRLSLSSSAAEAGASSAILTLDRSVRLTDPDLGPTIDAISSLAEIELVGLSAVVDNSGPTVSLLEPTPDVASTDLVRELMRLEGLDSQFAQIAENPELIRSERRLELLATLSNGWASDPEGWAAATSAFGVSSTELRQSVRIIKSSSITLLADRGSLPVIVINELNQPVTVVVTVRPLTPLIRVEDSYFDVTVDPTTERKALVPVQSISNGVVALEVTLAGVDGLQLGDTTYVKTTVQAGWETPFTIGAALVVVLIFAAGIVRTILRRRKAQRERIIIA